MPIPQNHSGSAAPGPILSRCLLLAVTLAAVVFLGLSLRASLYRSPIWDEPYHIAASLSYIEKGRIVVNQQHPPLLKELSGLFLRASGVRWPAAAPPLDALLNGGIAEQTGIRIISENGPDKVMFWSRLPFLLIGAGFVFVLFALGRALVGPAAALAAVFLFVLDPVMMAHTAFVATDMGLAFFITLFLLTLWHYLQKPAKLRLLWCGLALGGMLGAKFSAVVMLPVTVLLLAAAALWPIDAEPVAAESQRPEPPAPGSPSPEPASTPHLPALPESATESLLLPDGPQTAVLEPAASDPLALAPASATLSPAAAACAPPPSLVPRRLLQYGLALAAMCLIAFAVLQYIYLFPKDLLQYVAGMRLVNADHNPNYLYYMAGQFSQRFYSYYLVAYLLKEPLAAILAAGLGLFAVLRNKAMPRLALAFLLLPPAALFAGYTLFSDDMGVRYILPVLPFMHLLGGVGLATLFAGSRRSDKILAGVLCLWIVVAAAGIYPDQVSYFNEAACLLDDPANLGWGGGTRCGNAWLDDSNIDWAQGVKELKTWLDKNAHGRPLHFGYFGSFPPAVYGIPLGPNDYPDVIQGAKPGLYAVSAQILAHAHEKGPGHGDWLLRTKPIAFVGHTYFIYDLPEPRPGVAGVPVR